MGVDRPGRPWNRGRKHQQLWIMSHDVFLHQSLRRRTLLVPSGHTSTGLRASTPSVPADYATMSEAWPWQWKTRRHQADDGWNWIYLTPRYTGFIHQKLYGEFHDLNKTHQDELLDFVFCSFQMCSCPASFCFFLWWNSGTWAASFSLVDPWNIMWINPSPVHIRYTPMLSA